MKFGRNLPRNQVPEWAASYINYKGLKKLIKSASEGSRQSEDADLAGFFYALDRNLEDVDYFYNKKFGDFSRRLKLLDDRYGSTEAAVQDMDQEEVEDITTALLELRGQLRKLQWYGEVNRRGFIKITKKLDKKFAGADAQKKYLTLKVDPAPFATNTELALGVSKVNEWLSLINSRKPNKDIESVASRSLKRATSRPMLDLAPEKFAELEVYIQEDDTTSLESSLLHIKSSFPHLKDSAYQQFLKNILQRAIHHKSRECVALLLQGVVFLDDQDDINRRNCVHRLVITIGRGQKAIDAERVPKATEDFQSDDHQFITPAADPSISYRKPIPEENQAPQGPSRSDPTISLLQFLLDSLSSSQRSALLARDSAGKTPLHFAAHYGVVSVCQIIVEHLKAWKLFDVRNGIDGPFWQDTEGWAPLHLSVIGGHPLTTQTLLDAEAATLASEARKRVRHNSPKSSAVLALATKANHVKIVQILVSAGVDINYQDEQGEAALHAAARFGHDECAQVLLTGDELQKADTELVENTYAWTPLFIACVDGNVGAVELLIDAGADLEKVDASGWTAKEHASLRGHLQIASRLAELTGPPDPDLDLSTTASNSPPLSTSLNDRKSGVITPGPNKSDMIKTFGHRYLISESMVLVSLGTMDMRKSVKAVTLDQIPLAQAHSTQLDTALSIVVSASGARGEPEIIDLPVQDNISTDPMIFMAEDPTKVKLLFDLVPTYAGTHDRIVGRGVALLSSIKPSIGSGRMSLKGDITVPIVAASTLEVIGAVTFNFLIITPFKHPNMSVTENQTYWKSMAQTMVIGHRGLGKNLASRRSLQLGENTVQSFIAAANLGAQYVEFDVQLTKDHVPVIYHDFLVSETGIDAPVHTLTLEQFLHVSDSRTPRPSRPASPVVNGSPRLSHLKDEERSYQEKVRRTRSMSVDPRDDPYGTNDHMAERMKHTRTFKQKGFKGNSRGASIQAPFATLEDLFKQLPKSTGFNIEMKYPMLHESESEGMDTYAVELNNFVDVVLDKVYSLGKGRNMIFSSFNPDVCLLLSFKQPSIPVLFLTDSGSETVGDIRASSLQEAIRFASRWNLLGVVSHAQPFIISPRLVKVVKESGLVCVSYGVANNDPAKVKLQVKEGIDAVIVDSVLAIRKGLTEEESKKIVRGGGTSHLLPKAMNGTGTVKRAAALEYAGQSTMWEVPMHVEQKGRSVSGVLEAGVVTLTGVNGVNGAA